MFRSGIDPELKKELIHKVQEIVEEFKIKGAGHRDSFEEMFYSIAKAATLYHIEPWELMSLSTSIQESIGALEMFSGYKSFKKVSIFGSARTKPEDPEFQLAKQLGKVMKDEGYYVITGAGPGIMLAGHEGATREHSFGLNIKLPFEQSSNEVINGDLKDFAFRYFHTRKMMFIKESHALVACPGGFGTMDELFETLTLVQTGKSPIVPIVLLNAPGNDFWDKWHDLVKDQFLKDGLISDNDLGLYTIKNTAEEAKEEILNFYKVFDSYRFWKDNILIIRVKKELSNSQVKSLSDKYGHLVKAGTMHKIKKQPFFDHGSDKYKDMHYLGLNFNRRDYSTLRLLIGEINKC